MIQDIYPKKLNNSFKNVTFSTGDELLFFDENGQILVRLIDGHVSYPKQAALAGICTVYLFSIDEERFFLAPYETGFTMEGFSYRSLAELRAEAYGNEMLAVFTAYHLMKWYRDNRFCGRCGTALDFDDKERAMRCPKCGNVIYPRINPAVIVGVRNGDKILITRYNRGYAHNALVAGFTEIGETLEETVAREVMEETGIRVKNITYYKSQPWGNAQDILMGFYCDADGDTAIKRDENELKYAEWVERDKIVLQPDDLSLTNEMMKMFKENRDIH
ncbi:MAG: NAD(+) diphosphatase [Lachnospiraceae bacterium]|nr:NAD(+) diphosphatase [Lachnospiraceae bacterium]